MWVPLQEELDVFDAGRAVSVEIRHFLDLNGDRLGLLAIAVVLVVLTERELCAGDGGAIVASGDLRWSQKIGQVAKVYSTG